MKLTESQIKALTAIAARDGYMTPWCLGTRTCEALRRRGLIKTASGTQQPFGGRFGNDPNLWITEAGLRSLSGEG